MSAQMPVTDPRGPQPLSKLLKPLIDRIEKLAQLVSLAATYSWATVTVAAPVQVTLDGAGAPLAAKVGSAVDNLRVGDRVLVLQQGLRTVIVAAAHGGSGFERNYVGTSANRALTTARFGDTWRDTDGSKYVWKGASNGTWRRMGGAGVDGVKAWDTTQGSAGSAILAGRTVTATLPTTLEASESVRLTGTSVGSGFGIVTLQSVTKNVSSTTVTFRFMQIMSTTTQAVAYEWQIIDV